MNRILQLSINGAPVSTKFAQGHRVVSLVAILMALSVFVFRLGAPLALLASVTLGVLVIMLLRPSLATVAVVAILYSNLAPVAIQRGLLPPLVAAAVALPLVFPLCHALVLRRERLRVDTIFALMLLFGLAQLVSALFARDFAVAGARILGYLVEGVLVYLMFLNVVRTFTALHRVTWTLLAAGALLGGLSLYQSATGTYQQQFGGLAQRELRLEPKQQEQADIPSAGVRLAQRARGPLDDPNRFAQILLVLLPFALMHFRNQRDLMAKTAAVVLGGLILCGVLLSYSRGAFLTLALMGLCAARIYKLSKRHMAIIAGLVLAILLILAPNYFSRIQTLAGASGLISNRAAAQPEAVIRGRATEMLAAWSVFVEHPFFGVGPGHYMPFYSEEYQLRPENKLRYLAKPRRAHNLALEIAAETGTLGLLFFLAIPSLLLLRLADARRYWAKRRPEFANVAAAFSLAVIGYLGTGVFLHLAYERYLWLLLALAGAALQIFRIEAQSGWLRRQWSARSFEED